jgi:hypothetical protein
MVTAGLAAWLGPGWAVTVDGLVVFAGGLAILAWRPQVAWLGCAAPPRRVWRQLTPRGCLRGEAVTRA